MASGFFPSQILNISARPSGSTMRGSFSGDRPCAQCDRFRLRLRQHVLDVNRISADPWRRAGSVSGTFQNACVIVDDVERTGIGIGIGIGILDHPPIYRLFKLYLGMSDLPSC